MSPRAGAAQAIVPARPGGPAGTRRAPPIGMDVVSLPDSLMAIAARLVLATAMGAAIGANREIEGKSAGVRTHALVALGASLAALLGLQLSGPGAFHDSAASSRIVQGVVAGIGFVCGGVILRRGADVHGLTTAASLWVAAVVGLAVAAGLWRVAAIAAALAVAVLAARRVDAWLRAWHARRRGPR